MLYQQLNLEGGVIKKTESRYIKVGDLIVLNPNERAPADLLLLWTSDPSGSLFIRTDQLDGETDWKVRRPLNSTNNHIGLIDTQQPLANLQKATDLFDAVFRVEQPTKKIYEFMGRYEHDDTEFGPEQEAMRFENTMWANTKLAS